ncbi:Plasmodium vivax Vir protein, putative [Plasmodium vivax]|uniref:Vir protein, putative n=1 Tax=Plasmodium vivax TaxID=5855 RepID=A0A1G4E8G5_PLAVI|nr:Plasmodium vivax Vir protein, putative [Plasmodium vivax]
MTTNISYNDLPSVKFENKIKELIDYSIFESYKKNITEEGVIDNWVQSFQEKVEAYLTNSSDNLLLNNDKRCKHFNYLINTIINKVNSLSSNLGKKSEWSYKIKECRNKLFLSNNNILNCNENNKYIDEDYKILGNFCEDSDFIQRNFDEFQNSVHCPKIVEYMSTIKNRLLSVHESQILRGGIVPKIDEKCSTEFLDKIFPTINCNSSVKDSPQSDSHSSSVNHVGGDGANEKLMTQQATDHGELKTDRDELVTISEESELSDGQSSNTFNTVGLPIFGVLGCSFLLYKFTPVGSIFRSRIQNKGIIPINNDGYSTKQILSNIPNTNDIYSEKTQYKISYQTL